MVNLAPCPSCQRHVRVSELRCPFCDVALTAPVALHVPVRPHLRVMAMLAAAGVATTACGGDTVKDASPSTAEPTTSSEATGTTSVPTTSSSSGAAGSGGAGGVWGGAGGVYGGPGTGPGGANSRKAELANKELARRARATR